MVDKNETSPSPYWPEANLNTNDYEYWLHPYTRNVDPIFEVIKNWTRIMDDYSSKSEKKKPKLLILDLSTRTLRSSSNITPKIFGTGAMPFYMGLIFMTDQTDGFAVQKLVEENLDMLPREPGLTGCNKDFVDGLNILNLLLPGIPTTYYGEEIGMRDTLINSREELKIHKVATLVTGDPSKDRVKYDFTGARPKLTGKGRVVTASVNLYPKGGAPAPENSIASYGQLRRLT
ncbi:hypothetical protein BV898_06154 [Hypsibius exemplaris]|uniref:Uncharacterized protein n=1 Tax=Hypsibius exemplaris TaxID=2072580 RepID=A0A1W0WXJ0_HYPEX|nr:hypothetical protein BV898_06154 [Hypsibius exemplaris]